ncbi:MAG: hypothetical protein KJZ86_13175 [Caldilineaceae bacterium]|nr:hypothetical protein [Caldilineaceae bacterium]HRJ41988.1 hypothetical protein [Caldilineaceae bacterium]
MTTETEPTVEAWNRLYTLMAQVKEMAPWQWMYESEVFAVQDPESQELYFVSVMGSLGEHFSIAVYLGVRAYYRLLSFAERVGDGASGEELMEIAHLQASFEDREQLTSQDRNTIKQLGLKFRGKMAWPLFRSYRAGYAPWLLEADEVRILSLALEHLLDVAPRFAEGEIDFPEKEDHLFLRALDSDGNWQDRTTRVPPAAPESIDIVIPKESADAMRRLRRSHTILEADLFLMPGMFGERDSRPQMAYIFMVVDKTSGVILSGDPLYVETTFADLLAEVPKRMVQTCLKMQAMPAEIHAGSERVEWLLSSLSSMMDCKIKRVRRLRALDNARDAMFQFFMR